MSAILLLASENLDKHKATVRALGKTVACALTAGEGPSSNPKEQPNEDSLAVIETPAGVAACVADSHWGAGIGELLVTAATLTFQSYAPATSSGLVRVVRDMALKARADRSHDDGSESTFLVAVVRERHVVWASIADSHLYRIGRTAAERENHDLPLFAGADLERASERGIVSIEAGELDLAPGETLLLASDGIAPEMSGLFREDLAKELGGPGTLEERVRKLIDRGRKAPRGGKDNLALVAICP